MIVLSQYEYRGEILGRGSFGEVRLYWDKTQKKEVAIKKIKIYYPQENDSKEERIGINKEARQLVNEVSILRAVKQHENIIALEGFEIAAASDCVRAFLIFERYPTTIEKVVKSKQPLTDRHRQFFMYQILDVLHYLHSGDFIHGDLKTGNILVNDRCKIKVCDFGLARYIPAEKADAKLTEYTVTRWYRAPEILLECRNAVDKPIDMWSAGCILGELITGQPLFQGPGFTNEEKKVDAMLKLIFDLAGAPNEDNRDFLDTAKARGKFEKYQDTPVGFQEKFDGTPEEIMDLLSRLLEINPQKRITAQRALESDFLIDDKPLQSFSMESRSEADKAAWNNYKAFNNPTKKPVSFFQMTCDYLRHEADSYLNVTDESASSSSSSSMTTPVAAPNTVSPTPSSPRHMASSKTRGTVFHTIEARKNKESVDPNAQKSENPASTKATL